MRQHSASCSVRLNRAQISLNSVAAIVLAAGASSRLGTPKQLVRLGTETLLERTVRVAREAGLGPVLGVTAVGLSLEVLPQGMTRVINRDAAEGMASSIRTGIRALPDGPSFPGVVILACDQPAVTVEHLRALAAGGPDVVASAYARRIGIPAYFPKAFYAALLTLRGDEGARRLLQNARAIALPNGELDIDTMQDLDKARKLYLV